MIPVKSRFATVLQINMKLLASAFFGFLAWACWPTTPEWWGLGMFSIIIGGGAVGSLFDAIRLMRQIHNRDQAIAEYRARGGAPQSAEMAGPDKLKDGGML